MGKIKPPSGLVLDATAGNRMMWPNKNPPNTVFLDKEIKLLRPPHVFADFRFCPFRDNVFSCIIFDPPFGINMPVWWNKPDGPTFHDTFYGSVKSKRELLRLVYDAQEEFKRLTNRICFKWGERNVSLWKILPFFRDWKVVLKKENKTKQNISKKKTWWVTFVRDGYGVGIG